MKNVKRGGESDRAKDEGECMKRLEVLLENKVMPQTDEVCFAKDLKKIWKSLQETEFIGLNQWKIIFVND